MGEGEGVLLQEIDEAAGGGDHDVDPAPHPAGDYPHTP